MINLIHGDCLEVMNTFEDKSIDCVICDPPYGTTRCKWDSVVALDKMWECLHKIVKPRGAIVLTSAQPFTSVLNSSNLGMFKYDWIWEKGNATGFFNAKKMPLRAHEHVSVFYKNLPTYNPQITTGHKRATARKKEVTSACYGKDISIGGYDSTNRYPRSVQYFSSDKQKEKGNGYTLHDTQKPVALMEYLVNTYTNEGDTVLDFTMGAGTTGVACYNTGRNFIGIEKELKWFNSAKSRMEGL